MATAAAFRVQQAGWRDLKEYMETYGQPERWDNGFIRCTRVKSNGYYTYWCVFYPATRVRSGKRGRQLIVLTDA